MADPPLQPPVPQPIPQPIPGGMLERAIHLAYHDPATGHVPNPGTGFSAYVTSDHMHTGRLAADWRSSEVENPNQPLDEASFERMLALPYVDQLYFRLDWRDLQSAPGRLDPPPAWNWMLAAVADRGLRWSFRVMNASRHSPGPHSLPDFLAEELPLRSYVNTYAFGPPRKFYPDYTPAYLDAWRDLLGLLADRYDHDQQLDYVDVSGYGIWGEGHHYLREHADEPHDVNQHPPGAEDATARLLRDHRDAFSTTPLAMSLHYLDYAAGRAALDDPAFWLRRDSFQPFSGIREYAATARRDPARAIIWETIVPAFGNEPAPLFTSARLPQRYLDFGAHLVAVGFNPWDVIIAHEQRLEIYEQLAPRLGYRLRPAVVWHRVLDEPGPGDDPAHEPEHELVVALVNDGAAVPPGVLTVRATFPDGTIESVVLEPGHPAPAATELVRFPVPAGCRDLGSDHTVELGLTIRLRGKEAPVRWAVRQPLRDPYRLPVPWRTPPAGDPFLTRAGAYRSPYLPV